jgi:hypothetical protein
LLRYATERLKIFLITSTVTKCTKKVSTEKTFVRFKTNWLFETRVSGITSLGAFSHKVCLYFGNQKSTQVTDIFIPDKKKFWAPIMLNLT